MLLATACPPACEEPTAAVLGMPVARAREVVAELLAAQPRSGHVAVGAWYAPRMASPALVDLAGRAPAGAAAGPLPSLDELDRWVHDHTFGLFPRFPIELDPLLALLLVTLVAARASWRTPFEVAAARSLGDGPFAGQVQTSLWTPPGHDHRVAVVDTVAAGRVGVHQAPDGDGLVVTSVVAPDGVDRLDVLAAAREVATGGGSELDPEELELGHGPVWSVTEEQVPVMTAVDRLPPHCWAHLPAWSAECSVDLLADPSLGMAEVAAAVLDLLPSHLRANAGSRSEQQVRASYHAQGFEAAAVSYLATMAGAAPLVPRHEAPRRHLSIRFGRPYAVAAVDTTVAAWAGLPLFCGWIARPVEATDEALDDWA